MLNGGNSILWKTAAVAILMLCIDSVAFGQKVLFHGSGVAPDGGADGLVFDFLVDKLGAGNVTYLQGDMAAADGSSAAGFDAVIISSTLGSGTVRDKYEDIELPLLNWEQALTRQAVGEFNLSVSGTTVAGSESIDIVSSEHFITQGFAGTVKVVDQPHIFSVGTGDVAPGVSLLANLAGTDNHAIMVAEKDAQLLGDGSVGLPAVARERRAFLFLEDNTFTDINADGLLIVDRTIDWLLKRDLAEVTGDFNEDGVVDRADFLVMAENFNLRFGLPDSLSKGDMDVNGRVDLADFVRLRRIFNEQAGGGQAAAAVPEPRGLLLILVGCLAVLSGRRRRLDYTRNMSR